MQDDALAGFRAGTTAVFVSNDFQQETAKEIEQQWCRLPSLAVLRPVMSPADCRIAVGLRGEHAYLECPILRHAE